jgi:hypothetical protein
MSSSAGDNNNNGDEHYLDSFLQERLPALGLDYETYGSYVRGLVEEDDDTSAMDESDNTTWDEILELLQASSETHGDDSEVWIRLKQEIQSRRMQHTLEREQREQRQKQERWAEEHERLAQDIALAKQKAHEEELEQQQQGMTKKSKELDDTKRLLVARYAYDESEMYDKDGNLIAATGESDEAAMVSNKDAAAMASQEKLRQMKSQKTVSKKEEQQKTKQAKLDKVKLKEERRNRAQKGERHR